MEPILGGGVKGWFARWCLGWVELQYRNWAEYYPKRKDTSVTKTPKKKPYQGLHARLSP